MKLFVGLSGCAALAVSALALAVPAHAIGEAGDENASYVHSEFVEATGRGLKDGANSARKIAAQVCIDLARGLTSDQLAYDYAGSNLTVDDAGVLIRSSVFHFCPMYRNR